MRKLRFSTLIILLLQLSNVLCAQSESIFDSLNIGYISTETDSFKRFSQETYEHYIRKVHKLDTSISFEHQIISLREEAGVEIVAISSKVISPNCAGVAFEFRRETIDNRQYLLLSY
jgi:hypothetical protein